MNDTADTYKHVRALQRGLDVLVALNEQGAASVSLLAEQTGLHRTTVYRVLETLRSLGYVRRSETDDSYRPTAQVRTLSAGFDESERLANAAAASLNELLREIAWPSSVATPRSDAMVIRETTHGRTELFVHDVHVGTRSPVLTTAMGRAYLAYCSAHEREALLESVAASRGPEAALARDADYVRRIIHATREAGFGLSFGDTKAALGSVALPIHAERRVMGCVNVVFFTGAVGRQSAVNKFVPALRRAAAAIERNLARH
jgi:IclR family mhp operon transcriptional activator